MAAMLAPGLAAQSSSPKRTAYFPAAGKWQHKASAEVNMDAGKLKEAVDWAEAHGSKWDFEKDQVRVFGKVLGALPAQRAATNGIILRHGYIVAEFGDTKTNDPVYSVAKSFISTTASSTTVSPTTSTMAATTRRTTPRSPGKTICNRRVSGKAKCGVRTPTSSAWKSSATAR
jgi:hypothetical protein